nr:DUF1127 domain-containing protein [Rhodobaculum claviforme]
MLSETDRAPATRTTATFWQRLRDSLRQRRRFGLERRRLRAMTDAELDDMGISRGMITRVAFETAYGRKR